MAKEPAYTTSSSWRKQKTTQETLAKSVLCFIQEYMAEHHYSPSIREIGEQCGMGRATVTRYLDRLEVQGHITRDPGIARSITLTQSDQ